MHYMKIICILYTRFFWQLCEEDRVKSLVKGLDKKSLVRGLHAPDTFDVSKNPSSEMGKKVQSLIENWMNSKGSNDTWAREFWVYFLLLLTSKYHIIPSTDCGLQNFFKHFSEILHRRGDELGQCRCSILFYGLLPWWTFCNCWISWPVFRREWDRNANSFIVCI